jgi:hypothetical protein
MGDQTEGGLTMEQHVHCIACGCAIETTRKNAGGKRVEAEIGIVMEPRVVPGPRGQLGVVQQPRPACARCIDEITARQEQAKKVSRILVPTPGAPL